MELFDAISGRKSIRDFQPGPVAKELIDRVLEAALKAPSNSNRQPWEFLVVQGEKLEELRAGLEKAAQSGGPDKRELPTRDEHWPAPAQGSARAAELMRGMVGAAAGDGVAPQELVRSNFRFFGAPCVIVALMDKGYGTGTLVSIGAAIENLLLAAHDLGLGGCWMMIPLEFGGVFRSLFSVPEGKYLVSTIAIGYPNVSKINEFKSGRDPKEKFVKYFD